MLNYAVIFATGVIRVLVGALADDSAEVREAASSALQENARWYISFVSFFFSFIFLFSWSLGISNAVRLSMRPK